MFSKLKIFILIFVIYLSVVDNSIAQKSKKETTASSKTSKSKKDESNVDNLIIAEFPTEKISYLQIEKAFQKNLVRKKDRLYTVSEDSLRNFIELYINYRLKVLDAFDRGLDKDTTVLNDYNSQKKMLAENFIFDKELTEPNINLMMKMREKELQVAYMIFNFDPRNPNNKDSIRKIAEMVLGRLNKGEDFSPLAKEFSFDKESAKKGGLIPQFITSGRIQRPIEKVLFNLKQGEYNHELIETPYGYFIMKVIRAEKRNIVKARQILLTKVDSVVTPALEQKADSILNLLHKGADFAKLAEKISDDPQSAINGGDLGEYYSRSVGFLKTGKTMFPSIVEALYSLKEGQISGKVYSDYGIHIVKVDSIKPFPEEVDKDEVSKLYKRLYLEEDKANFIDTVAHKFGFKIHYDVLNKFISQLDSTKTNLDSAWLSRVSNDLNSQILFQYGNKNYTVNEYTELNRTTPKLKGTNSNFKGIVKAIKSIIEPKILDDVTKPLESQYPEFAATLKEFYDAILLFKVESSEVWEKLKFDSTLAKAYWDSTKSKYVMETMYDVSEILVLADSTAKMYYNQIKNGASFDTLAAKYTIRQGFREKMGNHGLVSSRKGKFVPILKDKDVKVGLMEPMKFENGFAILKINKVDPPRQKTFEEAIPDFSSKLQDIMQKNLTKNWLEKVKAKHPVTINPDAIKTLLQAKK